MKFVLFLFGAALAVHGIQTMWRREAKVSNSGDDNRNEEQAVYQGIPAMLIGLVELCIGAYLAFQQIH